MSKNSRRSSCQRDSDGTDAAHPWRYRTVLAEQIALATSGAVHIRLLARHDREAIDAKSQKDAYLGGRQECDAPPAGDLCTGNSASQAAAVIGRVGQPDAGINHLAARPWARAGSVPPERGRMGWFDNWLLA